MSSYAMRALLWDFDGTVADTEPLWIRCLGDLVRHLGAEPPAEYWRQTVGSSMARTVEIVRGWTGSTLPDETIAAQLVDRVKTLFAQHVADPALARELWRPGARELMAEAAEAGLPQAVVSATDRHVLEVILGPARLPLKAVVAGDEVEIGKPHPEGYLRAAAMLHALPEDCLAIEDSVNGALAANRAGCAVLAVPSVVVPPPAPRRVHADTLGGLTLADLDRLFREARGA